MNPLIRGKEPTQVLCAGKVRYTGESLTMAAVAEVLPAKAVQSGKSAGAGPRGWRFGAALLLLVSLVGAVMVVCAAQARMGMNTDGTAYYGTAKRVMAGEGPRWPYGFRERDAPLTVHFPPLFGLVAGHLSTAIGVGDPQVTVGYLHGVLLAGTLLLTG